jgi:heat shock protein HslJ
MKRILLLSLPVAMMVACSNPSNGTKTETTPPASTATATAPAAANIDGNLLGTNHWLLDNAVDASGKRIDALFVRADKPVTLDFKDGRLSVSNTCNHLGGSYTLEGNALTVGPMMSTQRACGEPGVMELDRLAGDRLQGKLTVRSLDAAGLSVATASGDVLTFRGEPTPETRYGGTGERVFMEVDAQTKPCSHPLIKDYQCLQVREVKYDDKGLEQGKRGAYENFYGNIEGYNHEPGVRNVLRLNRFQIKNPPADAPSVAYVLDMVVSSELVKK